MRVISGSLKGRRLIAPAGMATRPTADRIKESMFNILAGGFEAKRVLDLFAGSGSLGIEALSRGAASAVFVDRSKMALSALRRNIEALGLAHQSRIFQWDISKHLNGLQAAPRPFDLVFMDPPYETGAITPTLNALVACRALRSGTRIVIEHSRREAIVYPDDAMTLMDQRRFGKTLVSFLDAML